MLESLQKTRFCTETRYNVAKDKSQTSLTQGLVFGLIADYRGHIRDNTRTTMKYFQNIIKLLCVCVRQSKQDFQFTSIQTNKSHQSVLHVDKGNLVQSLIIALGNFQNGELYLHAVGKVGISEAPFFFLLSPSIPFLLVFLLFLLLFFLLVFIFCYWCLFLFGFSVSHSSLLCS